MAITDTLDNIDLSDRKTQIMLVGGVLVVGLAIARLRGGGEEEPAGTAMVAAPGFGSRSDAEHIFGGNSPGVIGWVGNSAPPPATPTPSKPDEVAATLDTIFRKGKSQQVTRAPESTGLVCPPGYIAVQQPGGAPRCTLVDDRLKQPGQRTSFVPSNGETAFLDGSGAAEIRAQAAAGHGTLDPDTRPAQLGRVMGSTGGFNALPAAITGQQIERIDGGESLEHFAGRVFGHEGYWPQLVRLNPELAGDKPLRGGDALRVQ